MYYLRFFFVLGVATLIHATCRQPTAVENFSFKNYSGTWYNVAFSMLDKRDEEIYKLSKCPKLTLEDGTDSRNKWKFHTQIGSVSEITLSGTFTVPDPNIGVIKENVLFGLSGYTYTVLCTDYVTYSAVYACLEVGPAYTTEWIVLHARDVNKTDEIMDMNELDNCYSELPIKSAKQLNRRSFTGCGKHLVNGITDVLNKVFWQ